MNWRMTVSGNWKVWDEFETIIFMYEKYEFIAWVNEYLKNTNLTLIFSVNWDVWELGWNKFRLAAVSVVRDMSINISSIYIFYIISVEWSAIHHIFTVKRCVTLSALGSVGLFECAASVTVGRGVCWDRETSWDSNPPRASILEWPWLKMTRNLLTLMRKTWKRKARLNRWHGEETEDLSKE